MRLLPVIPITLRHRGHVIDTYALVDSGAEHNVFPLEAAEELDFDLSKEHDVSIVGAGGKQTPGKAGILTYEIGKHRWTAPVIFSRVVNERPLLGQAGFFRFFTVTFRHTQREVEIRWSDSIRIAGWDE